MTTPDQSDTSPTPPAGQNGAFPVLRAGKSSWTKGDKPMVSAIVCDQCIEDGFDRQGNSLDYYGGYLVAESVPPSLVEEIMRRCNAYESIMAENTLLHARLAEVTRERDLLAKEADTLSQCSLDWNKSYHEQAAQLTALTERLTVAEREKEKAVKDFSLYRGMFTRIKDQIIAGYGPEEMFRWQKVLKANDKGEGKVDAVAALIAYFYDLCTDLSAATQAREQAEAALEKCQEMLERARCLAREGVPLNVASIDVALSTRPSHALEERDKAKWEAGWIAGAQRYEEGLDAGALENDWLAYKSLPKDPPAHATHANTH